MDKKISELDLVSTLDVNDVLPIVNQGSTKKVKISQLVVTNLSYAPAISSGQVVSDNGTSATIPLSDSVNAGLFSPVEKSKLNGIATGAEVNVNADWNATTGDALILNKPTILSPENFIPYVGATANLNMGEYGISASQITLDTTPTQVPTIATTQWNDTAGLSQTTLKGGNVIIKNGSDLVARIVNKVSPNTTLTKANYQAVRISGATGQRLSVELARANNDANSADTIGLVAESIAPNQEGFIITMGQIEEINTSGSLQGETWNDGDVLYLSPSVAGRVTNVKPNGSNGHIVVIGYVEYSHSIHGKIYVKVMNGWELDELHNVYINAEANEDFLQYESATQLWKNKALTDTLIKSKLGITTLSGNNTGDNATNTQYSGLATSKQDTLVSTVNIKSINGNTLVGAGDLVIGSAVQSSYSILANNTNASAIPTAQVYRDVAEQTYSGTLIWTTTAPTSIVANTYKWNQVGSLVTVRVNLSYVTAGSITQVTISLPTDMPTPLSPTGFTGALDILYYGTGMFNTTTVAVASLARVTFLRRNSANTGYEFVIAYSSAIGARAVHLTLQYFT
jgi:nitrogen fixation protein